MPINHSELMAECVEESSEGAVIVVLTFIVLPSPQGRNCRMDGVDCLFRHLRKAVGEMCTMYYGSFNSGLQTRAAQTSLLSNENLYLMRLVTIRSVSTTEKSTQMLL